MGCKGLPYSKVKQREAFGLKGMSRESAVEARDLEEKVQVRERNLGMF